MSTVGLAALRIPTAESVALTIENQTMLEQLPHLLIIFAVAFLLGSIPWGVIISRVFYRTDIREHGSGNIGTTNAMRSLGKVGGVVIFILDFGKGVLATVVGLIIYNWMMEGGFNAPSDWFLSAATIQSLYSVVQVMPEPIIQSVLATASCGAVLGHIFTPWLKFKGGKGIAVSIGVLLLTYSWLGFCLELSIFIVLVFATRTISIGSIVSGGASPFMGLWLLWGNPYAIAMVAIAGFFVVWAHRGNFKRIMDGTESKIGDKKKAMAETSAPMSADADEEQ